MGSSKLLYRSCQGERPANHGAQRGIGASWLCGDDLVARHACSWAVPRSRGVSEELQPATSLAIPALTRERGAAQWRVRAASHIGPAPPQERGCRGCAPGDLRGNKRRPGPSAAQWRCNGRREGRCVPGRNCHPPRGVPASQPTHGAHEVVPDPLHVPRGQSRQELRPSVGLYVPEAQGAQFP